MTKKKKKTRPIPFSGLGMPVVGTTEEDADHPITEREKVFSAWEKLSVEERHVICRTCTSYFPKEEGNFECLSGHGLGRAETPAMYEKPCPSFSQAVFRLCDDWDYSPRQVYLTRELERLCKSASGEWGDDDED